MQEKGKQSPANEPWPEWPTIPKQTDEQAGVEESSNRI
jgi:hypothetical protein